MDLGLPPRAEERRRVIFVWKREGDLTIDSNIMKIINRMKEVFTGRGISICDNDIDDEKQCNLSIVFVTKDFLIDCYYNESDDTKLGPLFRWLGARQNRGIIICDNKERKFQSFLRFCLEKNFTDSDPDFLSAYGISDEDIQGFLSSAMDSSDPRTRYIVSGESPSSPDEIEEFVAKYAQELDEALKPMGLDYFNLDLHLRSDILDIYDHLMLTRKTIPKDRDDFLLAVFAGCQCRCFDMITISKMLTLCKTSTPFMKFSFSVTLPREEYLDLEYDDPIALQKALIRCIYSVCEAVEPIGHFGHLRYHTKSGENRYKYFVRIEDFDVSNPHAHQQLENIVNLFGRKSLIIITTNTPSELLESKMDFVSRVRGTTCKNDPKILSKCYMILKSQLIGKETPILDDDEDYSSYESDNAMDIGPVDGVSQSAVKKLKTSYV